MDDRAQVAVIGGGYAGCAAAATLASRGVRCVLFEAAPVLGGRARRVERDGLRLDNGQHLMLGAYEATLGLLDTVGARRALVRRPLAIVPFSPSVADALALEARRAPGRLGLLLGLLAARGFTWRERLANIAWFRAL
jgi:phytoene dehydrogenase-like protein